MPSQILPHILVVLLLVTTNGIALAETDRGYDQAKLDEGKRLFDNHCAVCHGVNAAGTVADWKTPDAAGKYPPPPLNGTAHTWHHPLGGLMTTIRNGTIPIGGNMPGWKDTLGDEDIFSIVLYLTSLWPEPIFEAWMRLNQN